MSTLAALLFLGSPIPQAALPSPEPLTRPEPTFVDVDGDGRTDLILALPGGGIRILRRLADGGLEDVTRRLGAGVLADALQASFADVNDDGAVDLLAVRSDGTLTLLRNESGTGFACVDTGSGLEGVTGVRSANLADVDADGAPDLLLQTVDGYRIERNAGRCRFETLHVERLLDEDPLAHVPNTESARVAELEGQRTDDGARSSAPSSVPLSGAPVLVTADVVPRGGRRPVGPGQPGETPRPVSGGSGGIQIPDVSGIQSAPSCAQAIEDQSSSTCLLADSTPTPGRLYPLGPYFNIDAVTGNVGMGTLAPGYALEVAGQILSGTGNSAGGVESAVGGGKSNNASGAQATIAGGESNLATGVGATVGGGLFNLAVSDQAAIGGGVDNSAGYRAFVGGGQTNDADFAHAAVVGGKENVAGAPYAAVGGGEGNLVSADHGFAGAGFENEVGGTSSAIIAGEHNVTEDLRCFVGAGYGNSATDDNSVVVGGTHNTASGSGAAVVAGQFNSASGNGSFVGGGGTFISPNVASGARTVVVGGEDNTASAGLSFVGGGGDNEASDFYAGVGWGAGNVASAFSSLVGGGSLNEASGNYATVTGGVLNVASGETAFVGGGGGIAVGQGNTASGANAVVVGGRGNDNDAQFATLGGGRDNEIFSDGGFSVLGGGEDNSVRGGWTTIGGGKDNSSSSFSSGSTISGGLDNTVGDAFVASIGGGTSNSATGTGSVVGGGDGNLSSGSHATVPGGRDCEASGIRSFAAGAGAGALHDDSFVWSAGLGSFDSTASGQFLIDAYGGVGIGTPTPSAALEVAGSIRASGSGASLLCFNPNDAGAQAKLDWKDDVARIRVGGSGAGAQNGLDIQTTGDTSLMRIRHDGRVGIGTTSPSEDLHVVGDARIGTQGGGDGTSERLAIDGLFGTWNVGTFNSGAGNFYIHPSETTAADFQITPDGKVSIQAGSTISFDLEVNGTAGKPGGGSWSVLSDRRLKKNVADLEQALETLLALRGVTYEYKDPEAIGELDGTRTGFLAQEVEAVLPDWVDEREDGTKYLSIRGFEALVVEALRELRDENTTLREELSGLHAALARTTASPASPTSPGR